MKEVWNWPTGEEIRSFPKQRRQDILELKALRDVVAVHTELRTSSVSIQYVEVSDSVHYSGGGCILRSATWSGILQCICENGCGHVLGSHAFGFGGVVE